MHWLSVGSSCGVEFAGYEAMQSGNLLQQSTRQDSNALYCSLLTSIAQQLAATLHGTPAGTAEKPQRLETHMPVQRRAARNMGTSNRMASPLKSKMSKRVVLLLSACVLPCSVLIAAWAVSARALCPLPCP